EGGRKMTDLMGDGTDVIDATNDAAADEGAEQPDAQQSQEQGDTRANREAAKYRRQLREVEAERDELRQALTTARATILAGIADRSVAPGVSAELFPDPDAYFSADGTVNRAALDATIQQAREARPYLFHTRLE